MIRAEPYARDACLPAYLHASACMHAAHSVSRAQEKWMVFKPGPACTLSAPAARSCRTTAPALPPTCARTHLAPEEKVAERRSDEGWAARHQAGGGGAHAAMMHQRTAPAPHVHGQANGGKQAVGRPARTAIIHERE